MIKEKLKLLGPGLIYAGAAVGVSHLVQSTRAGANYGFDLLWIVVLANVVKYPYFEASSRYCAATGENLLQGYKKIGTWAVILALLMTISTMFIIQAAVTVVTAGLIGNLLDLPSSTKLIAYLLLIAAAFILALGHYKALDKVIKFIVFALAITTIITLSAAFIKPVSMSSASLRSFEWGSVTDIAFVVALVGWMPGPLDISLWSSLWSQEKNDQMKRRLNLKEALFDFKFGYIGTTFLAMAFLSLGALIMWPQGKVFSGSAVAFSKELIDLYSIQLGSWSRPFIAFAATATMISTTITCLDAFPRVLKACFANLDVSEKKFWNHQTYYLIFVSLGTMFLVQFFLSSMKSLVDVATTVSFVVAPVIAILNHKVMLRVKDSEFSWGIKKIWFSRTCLAILTGFTLYYVLGLF